MLWFNEKKMSDEPNGVECNSEMMGLPIEKLVECFYNIS